MVKKRFNISLDVKNSSSNRPIEVVEGDNGNEIRVVLTDEGKPVDLSGCRVLAIFSKSDGRTAEQDSAGHGILMEEESEGSFTIELYTGSFSPGLVECEIQVLSGEEHTTLITSAKFNFSCRRSIMNGDTVQATDEYPVLVELIDRVNKAEEGLLDIAEFEQERRQAEEERRNAEEEREALSEKWAAVTAVAETLPPNSDANVSVTLCDEGAAFHFGLPKGMPGDNSRPHGAQHSKDGDDAVTPKSIGAAEERHVHSMGDVEGLDTALRGSIKHVTMQIVTLRADDWNGNAQTLSVSGMSETADVQVGLAMTAVEEQVSAAAGGMLLVTAQSEDELTVTAFGEVPAVDIPVMIWVREVPV